MQITDIAIDDSKKIIADKFDFLLQEIDILFDTSKGEVLGEDTFGTAFENFLWDLDINNVKDKITAIKPNINANKLTNILLSPNKIAIPAPTQQPALTPKISGETNLLLKVFW